jgi:hypothetical protein
MNPSGPAIPDASSGAEAPAFLAFCGASELVPSRITGVLAKTSRPLENLALPKTLLLLLTCALPNSKSVEFLSNRHQIIPDDFGACR